MRKNDVLVLTADALGAALEGVCRADGMAVFVPGLLPGETAQVRIVKLEKRYAFGRMEALVSGPSPDRRENDCPAYPRCGGCKGRHMRYAATLDAKRAHVQDCFARIAHLSVEVPPVLGMADPTAYRNKTALPVGGTAAAPVLGFYAPRSHAIIPAERCPNAMPPAGEIGAAFLQWMQDTGTQPYHEETHTGLVRHLVIRVNRAGQAIVAVVVNGRKLPHWEELARRLASLGAAGLVLNENRARTNVIFGETFTTLWGSGTLEDELCGLHFTVSPAAFFQVNPAQTERLYGTALDFAGLRPGDRLCDVYCGAGTITLTMARSCAEAVGIEVVPQAVANAEENARRNGISNARFHAGAAEELLPRLVAEGLRPDVIVVDPPRKGLEPAVIEAMMAADPRRIVYVSCDVATQARDAALLAAGGWRPEHIQPVDMFPWTEHVENVAAFGKSPEHSAPAGL